MTPTRGDTTKEQLRISLFAIGYSLAASLVVLGPTILVVRHHVSVDKSLLDAGNMSDLLSVILASAALSTPFLAASIQNARRLKKGAAAFGYGLPAWLFDITTFPARQIDFILAAVLGREPNFPCEQGPRRALPDPPITEKTD